MPANVIESGIGTLNYGKQSAKGTKATAATTTVGYAKPKWFDGQLGAKQMLANEEFVDGQRFGSPSIWVDTVGGEVGTLTIQAQASTAALFMAQLLGADTVTGSADPWTHTIASSGTSGSYGTWWQKVGSTVGPNREAYWDSKIGKLVLTCGKKQNPLHYAMSILAVQPAETFTVDAAKTEDTEDPFYWTEAATAVEMDSLKIDEANEEVLEVDTALKPYWGTGINPNQVIEGKGTIVRTLHAIVTDETLKKYKKAIYGEEAPAAGKAPQKTVFYAVFKTKYEKTANRTCTIESPKVAVDPKDMEIGPLREGGEIPITFGGNCLKSGAEAALKVIVKNGEESAMN